MEFNETVARRHSVRKFTDQEVDRELIDKILSMAMTAPSSKNSKSSGFMVVTDKSTIEALSEMRTSGSSFMKNAPAVVIVLGNEEKSDMWLINSSISATYIYLAATSLGLGSCWVQIEGRTRDKNNPESGLAEDYVRELLGVRDEMRILCAFALGYEAE